MINVTERAKKALKKMLAAHVDVPQGRLRLMDRGQGKLGLGIDIESPDDETVKYDGLKVLVVEPVLARSLKGVTLDVEDNVGGSELIISYGA